MSTWKTQKKLWLKLLLIMLLSLGLLIPIAMIEGVVSERSNYLYQVEEDIASSWTGRQMVVGPILALPYKQYDVHKAYDQEAKQWVSEKRLNNTIKWAFVIPESINTDIDIETDRRQRGIYSVPVYKSAIDMDVDFNFAQVQEVHDAVERVDQWLAPRLVVGVNDVRGIVGLPSITLGGDVLEAQRSSDMAIFDNQWVVMLDQSLVDNLSKNTTEAPLNVSMSLRGMRALSVVPVADHSMTNISSDWQHPKFSGRFLPNSRSISSEGFTAQWETSSFNSSVDFLWECVEHSCGKGNLSSHGFSVELIDPVDVYDLSGRATKYGFLFLVLTFGLLFVTEVLKNIKIHPVQYSLVGLALSLFYLLLVSLTEHIDFMWAYLCSSTLCIAVISVYFYSVLGKARMVMVSLTLSALYLMLYVILNLEDHALLVGSFMIFAALSAVMYVTRRIDWYQVDVKESNDS